MKRCDGVQHLLEGPARRKRFAGTSCVASYTGPRAARSLAAGPRKTPMTLVHAAHRVAASVNASVRGQRLSVGPVLDLPHVCARIIPYQAQRIIGGDPTGLLPDAGTAIHPSGVAPAK
jgi:hypothetical protein